MNISLQPYSDSVDPLLSLLDITPHCIVPADDRYRHSPPVITVYQVDQYLDRGVKNGWFTADESEVPRAQAVAVGLPVDTRAVIARALECEVEGDLGDLSFRVCTCENCTALPGLSRGRYFRGDIVLTGSIVTMVDAFEAALQLTSNGCLMPWQAILLLRQTASYGIPIDSERAQEILDEIPSVTQLAYLQRQEELGREQERSDLAFFGIVIIGSIPVKVIEIDISNNVQVPKTRVVRPPLSTPDGNPSGGTSSWFKRLFGR